MDQRYESDDEILAQNEFDKLMAKVNTPDTPDLPRGKRALRDATNDAGEGSGSQESVQVLSFTSGTKRSTFNKRGSQRNLKRKQSAPNNAPKKKAKLPPGCEEAIVSMLDTYKTKLEEEFTTKFTKIVENELRAAMSAVGVSIGKAIHNHDQQITKKIDEAIKTFSEAQAGAVSDFMDQRWNGLVSEIIDTLKRPEDGSETAGSLSLPEFGARHRDAIVKLEPPVAEEAWPTQIESTKTLFYDIEQARYVEPHPTE